MTAARSDVRKRRARKGSGSGDATSTVLSPEQLIRAEDIPATAPIPEFSETVEYRIRIDGTASPKVRVETDAKGGTLGSLSSTLIISAKGSVEEVPPCTARAQRLTRRGLAKTTARVHDTRASRPAWLRQVYVPKTLPLRTVGGQWTRDLPLHPLVERLMDREFPWCAIGRVETTRRGQPPRHGSGVLVGPNLLLTASHVMPWDTDDSSIRFIPAYRAGNDPRFGHAYVDRYRGVPYDFSNDTSGIDYVICKLNWRIGDRTGWLGSQSWGNEDRYYDGLWFSAGYPLSFIGGELPAAELWIAVEDIDNDGDGLQIETDNFTSEGWSGGPLWGWIDDQPRVIGVLSGMDWDWPDPKRSMFAGGRHMVDLVRYGHANWS